MACKDCGDNSVSSPYRCNACIIKTGRFKWCVITKTPDEKDKESNHYDEVLHSDEIVEIGVDKNSFVDLKKHKVWVHIKREAFILGEMFPVDPYFEREMTVLGRKPGKWFVEYELFSSRDYKKAMIRATELGRKAWAEETNLELLERKYEESVQLAEYRNKLKTVQDPVKLIYDWIKQGHISLKDAKTLIKIK